MSTLRPTSRRRGRARLPVLAYAGSLLVSLQLWLALSSTALASQQTPQVLSPQFDVARAGVSVVRLLVTYKEPGKPEEFNCTGLGTIVASWSASNASEKSTWILTDGHLISNDDQSPAPCVENQPEARLDRLEVHVNDLYTSDKVLFKATANEATVACVTNCSEDTRSIGQSVLVGLNNKQGNSSDASQQFFAEPYADVVDTLAVGPALGFPLILQKAATTISQGTAPTPPVPTKVTTDAGEYREYQQLVTAFRTPARLDVPFTSLNTLNLEPGTPTINDDGELTGMRAQKSVFPVEQKKIHETIEKLVPDLDITTKLQSNKVHADWNEGLREYYGKDQPKDQKAAQQSFQRAANANPLFKAPLEYNLSIQEEATPTPTPSNNSDFGGNRNSNASQQEGRLFGMELWQLAIIGLIVLVAFLGLVTLLIRRSRGQAARRQRLEQDWAEADRKSDIEAQRIQAMETAQQAMAQRYSSPVPAIQPGMATPQQGPVMTEAQAREMRCPRCGTTVAHDAKFCPQCNTWLSPSESGLHMRMTPQQSTPQPAPSMAEMPTMPHPPVSPAPALAVPFAEQPTVPASSLRSANSLAEQPTVAMTPQMADTGQEKTVPYPRNAQGANLGLVIGTRSDPGIKRKYKPNEDSLFAAQGNLTAPTPHPFGLFVVADGMGGHANGQEASRLAIQRIIEYILPRLMKGGVASNEAYTNLLIEGIQNANQAVHARNAELRGDMGTTVTAALLVEATAYVANVGDSRTYLYSQAENKLSKVTTDHSVVASLVEAGIIKPDDIYTHPKRSHIYRSLGEKAVIEVDDFTVSLHDGDRLLLCSDGLWDMVRDPKIEEVMRQAATDPTRTSEALIQAALDGGGEDNVSVVVVQVTHGAQNADALRLQVLAMPDTVKIPPM